MKIEGLIVTEYYFDLETTGFNFDKDEIIPTQFQRLNGFTGEPIGELEILKRWESSEKEIIEAFLSNLRCRPFDFIVIGKNLLFDFCILKHRMKHFNLGKLNLRHLYERVSLDIKPLLVIMNKGSFKGYDKVIPKTNPITNDQIPMLFREGNYSTIIQYIRDEASDFINAYQILKKEMPKLKSILKK
jgi:hypothetical protein